MKALKYAVCLVPALLAAPQAFACFTVYSASNQVLYSGMSPPIDMSYQIHERLPAVFPGSHMVFGLETDCPSIDTRRPSAEFTNTAALMPASGRTRAPRADRQ